MKIYNTEQQDGLSEVLNAEANLTVAFTAPLTVAKKKPDQALANKILKYTQAANLDQKDLFYLDSIMVTTGMNRNDDVFIPEELWKARHTPVDKPLNLQHNPSTVIGHITDARVIDDDHNTIDDDAENIPDKFHIATSAVIYKCLDKRNPLLTQAISTLIEEIKNGEWSVSMEVLFNDFDYWMSDGSNIIIRERNEETCFLTKHLRIYGGEGSFGEFTSIGRVLKNMTFNGKGIVKEPANPHSVIFDTYGKKNTNGVINNRDKDNINSVTVGSTHHDHGEINMADNTQTVDSLQAEIAKLKDELSKVDKDRYESAIAEKDSLLETKNKAIDTLNTEKQELVDAKASVDNELKEANEALAKVKAEVDELNKQVDGFKAEAKQNKRLAHIVDSGIDKAEATKLLDLYKDFNDEQFNHIIARESEFVKTSESSKASENSTEEKEDNSEEESEAAATEVLENKEENEQAVGNVTDDEEIESDNEVAMANLSQFCGYLLKQKK